MTNEEYLKSLSGEELAKLLNTLIEDDFVCDEHCEDNLCTGECTSAFAKWLKTEHKGE